MCFCVCLLVETNQGGRQMAQQRQWTWRGPRRCPRTSGTPQTCGSTDSRVCPTSQSWCCGQKRHSFRHTHTHKRNSNSKPKKERKSRRKGKSFVIDCACACTLFIVHPKALSKAVTSSRKQREFKQLTDERDSNGN